jgi:CHRD domain
VQIIEASNQMKVNIAFSGLSGITTVAHIHGPTATAGTGTAGVMTPTPTFPGFPAGVSSGSYEQTFDLLSTSTYRSSFITASGGTTAGARDAFLAALLDGKAYLNVHSSTFTGGEIRGFFAPAQVPAPLPLLGAGAALGWSRRLRQRLASSSR